MYCFSTLTMKKTKYVHVMHTRPNTRRCIWLRKKFSKSKRCLKIWSLTVQWLLDSKSPWKHLWSDLQANLLKHLRGKRFRIKGRSFSRLLRYWIEKSRLPTSFAVATEGEVFGGARVTGSVAAVAEATRLVAAKNSRLTVTYWPTPSMPG